MRIVAAVCVFGPRSRGSFSVYRPLNQWRGSRVPTLGTPSPPPPIWPIASEDLAVFTLDGLFSGT